MDNWRPVVGYEGLYEVSRSGEVRSVDRVVGGGGDRLSRRKGRTLSLCIGNGGYLRCGLSKGGKSKTYLVHRLVLFAWFGPRPEGCECCHGPNGKTDNSVENLRWDTRSANQIDREKDGTANNRPVRRSDGKEYPTLAGAAKDSGCAFQRIWHVCQWKRGRRTTGGYGWEYID